MGTTSMVGGSGASTRSDTSGTDASVSVINIHDYPQPKPSISTNLFILINLK